MDKLRDDRRNISMPLEKTNNASTSKANMYRVGKVVAVPKTYLELNFRYTHSYFGYMYQFKNNLGRNKLKDSKSDLIFIIPLIT